MPIDSGEEPEEKEIQRHKEKQQLLERIAELEEALKNKADSKTSKKPHLNYGMDHNKPTTQKQKKKRKCRKPSTGRKSDAQKFEKADDILNIYPNNTPHAGTCETDRGAKKRGIIMSVCASLKKRWKDFSLANIVAAIQEWMKKGIPLFKTTIEIPPG